MAPPTDEDIRIMNENNIKILDSLKGLSFVSMATARNFRDSLREQKQGALLHILYTELAAFGAAEPFMDATYRGMKHGMLADLSPCCGVAETTSSTRVQCGIAYLRTGHAGAKILMCCEHCPGESCHMRNNAARRNAAAEKVAETAGRANQAAAKAAEVAGRAKEDEVRRQSSALPRVQEIPDDPEESAAD